MDIFSHVSDPLPFESEPLSDASSTVQPRKAAHSDKDVLLATSMPKKRAGRRIFKETRHPIFRGVRRKNNNKWVCEVREPNKKTRIWLGTYTTPEMAARAHDVAALTLRGKSACLNFADSAWRLPLPASTNAKDIRKTAAEAAEAFRPLDNIEVRCIEESDVKLEEVEETLQENKVSYIDEEEVFHMPRLLVNMAEGLLISPPPLVLRDDDDRKWDVCYGSLWDHSI